MIHRSHLQGRDPTELSLPLFGYPVYPFFGDSEVRWPAILGFCVACSQGFGTCVGRRLAPFSLAHGYGMHTSVEADRNEYMTWDAATGSRDC
jgi:hypothetical protein